MTVYPMNDGVIEKLFEYDRYTRYVVCKTISHERFEVEVERKNLLWETYVSIFRGTGYNKTRGYMAGNHGFLEEIMSNKEYVGIANDNILPLAQILQDKECTEYIFTLDSVLCVEYMKKVQGFKDRDAAAAFVSAIENNSDVLRSDDVYCNVHAKLVDGHLKGKYTRIRNKHGMYKET